MHSNIYSRLGNVLYAYYLVVSETERVPALREFIGEAGVRLKTPIKQVNKLCNYKLRKWLRNVIRWRKKVGNFK